jgi:hypothetical protein
MKLNRRNIEVDETRLRELWAKNLNTIQIATLLKVMEWDVVRAARRLALPDRRRRRGRPNAQAIDPTQFEIEQRCLEVRATWNAPERELRKSGRAKGWRPPVVQTFGKIQ